MGRGHSSSLGGMRNNALGTGFFIRKPVHRSEHPKRSAARQVWGKGSSGLGEMSGISSSSLEGMFVRFGGNVDIYGLWMPSGTFIGLQRSVAMMILMFSFSLKKTSYSSQSGPFGPAVQGGKRLRRWRCSAERSVQSVHQMWTDCLQGALPFAGDILREPDLSALMQLHPLRRCR